MVLSSALLALGLQMRPLPVAERIVAASRAQIGVTVTYDPAYVRLKYPGGDVPNTTGVCTDVVIRALRAVGADLQRLIHEDWKRSPRSYGGGRPDPNIDHRRVIHQMQFFGRRRLSVSPSAVKAGDFLAWKLPNGRLHIGVVSSVSPVRVVHNIGLGAREESPSSSWKVIGCYRRSGR